MKAERSKHKNEVEELLKRLKEADLETAQYKGESLH